MNNKVDKDYSNSKTFIYINKFKMIELKGYKNGKLDIIINKELYDELYDHNDEITCIHYNERLNMFCTASKDGFICLYMYPNKLMTAIKNLNGNYFKIAFLISNTFPSIIAIEEKNYELISYSINGFLIKKVSILNLLELKEKKNELGIYHYINEKGGTFKDRLFIIVDNIKGKEFSNKYNNKEKEKNKNNYIKKSKIYYLNKYSKIYDVVDKDLYFQYHNNNIELKGYKIGKLEVFINNTLYDELYDHNNVITCIHYNERLNMFCTTSKDGFLCLYMFPNKLMTTIKNPNGNYFKIAFLISNPFPSIIAIEEKNYELFSYSINGFFIKKASILGLLELKEKKNELGIYHFINEKGGTFKDRLFIIEENIKGKIFKCQLFNLPFFEKEEKLFEIKKKN